MKGFIYKISSPSNKFYIGQTINLEDRESKYKNLNCKNQIRLYRSIIKYGWESHLFEIIEECDVKLLNEKEIEWIKYYDSFFKGLNCTLGGSGNSGKIVSEETKSKMRAAKIGKKQSKETIDKRVEKLKGKKRTDEMKKNLSKKHTGKKLTEEHRENIRKVNIGKILSEEHKRKISEGLKRKYEYGK